MMEKEPMVIVPGGKARNMAQMAAAYLGPGQVAMIGRTSQDPYGLWKVPFRSLSEVGVNTKYIKIMSFRDAGHSTCHQGRSFPERIKENRYETRRSVEVEGKGT